VLDLHEEQSRRSYLSRYKKLSEQGWIYINYDGTAVLDAPKDVLASGGVSYLLDSKDLDRVLTDIRCLEEKADEETLAVLDKIKKSAKETFFVTCEGF